MKHSLKLKMSLLLLALTSIGLTITTLHSHHHLEWTHTSDFSDTGQCLTIDTTHCPITGYIFETEVLATSHSSDIFFRVEEIVTEQSIQVDDHSTLVHRGRSPPVLI